MSRAGTRLLTPEQRAEAERIVAEAHGHGSNGGPPPPTADDRYTGRVLDVAAMLARPRRPVPWRCEGVAVDGHLTVLAGRGKEGKSWLALALACGVARGKPAAGIPCAAGKALIFDAENGTEVIKERFHAAAVTADLAVQPVECGGLHFSKDLDWFRQTIEAQQANLVVVDSLRVLSSGVKESDGDEMEPVITALKLLARDTGAAIILIHHRGKGESDYRGSSVILDQADMLLTLGRVQGDPEGKTRRKVHMAGIRVAEEPDDRWVAIEADRSRGLVYVNAAEPYESEGGGTPVRDGLRDEVLGVLTGVSQSQARIAQRVGRDPKDQTVRRLLRDLAADGLAEQRPDGWGGCHAESLGNDTRDTPPPNGPGNGALEPNEGGVTGGVIELPLTPPSDHLCQCREPARSPRAGGPDHCRTCKRPIGEGGAA